MNLKLLCTDEHVAQGSELDRNWEKPNQLNL